jgi:hypothetical protein
MKHKKTAHTGNQQSSAMLNCASHHQFFSFERALQTIEVMLIDM